MRFKSVLRAMGAVAAAAGLLVALPAAASAAPAGYQIALGPPVTIPAGGGGATYAPCPSGAHATGGGWTTDYGQNPGAVGMRSSYPAHMDGVDRWSAQAHNTGQQPITLRPYAVCVNGLSQYEVRKYTNVVAGGQTTGMGAGCPDPIPELGGGFDIETGFGFAVTGVIDYASSGGHFRGPAGRNTSAQGQQWTASVVCGSGGLVDVQLAEVRNRPAPQGIATIDVSCPAGMSVLAGGGGTDSGQYASALLASYPLSSTQWRTVLRVDEPAGVRSEGWAVCSR